MPRHWPSLAVGIENVAGELAVDEEEVALHTDMVTADCRDWLRQELDGRWHVPPGVQQLANALGDRECHEVTTP